MSTIPFAYAMSSSAVPDQKSSTELLESIVATHPDALRFQQLAPHVQKCRSLLVLQPEDLPYSLLGTTLSGPEAITQPHAFIDDEAGCLLAFYHLGCKLAGHRGIVHGGVSAAILDECMGRACFPRLPGRIAVTVNLELEYKSPIPVNSTILVRAETKKVQGRKAWVQATVRDAVDGRDLVKAAALFIQPKWASEMSQVI